jgi:site-specific DNA-methyltransferase (adenine-specific)
MLTITNEDCMDLMARYPDGYFDLAICDPPYGIHCDRGTRYVRKKVLYKKWDTAPPPEYFQELFRVSKNKIIFGGNYFNLPVSKEWVCWFKGNSISGRSFSECELAWTSFDVHIRHVEIKPFIYGTERIHTAQKPVELYAWLLKIYARPGWKILDTHLGAGSIAIACHNAGYDLIACEIENDYYTAAMERINKHLQQQELFPIREVVSVQPILFNED